MELDGLEYNLQDSLLSFHVRLFTCFKSTELLL
jgi:hypothetical protein